jgi:hypothetical protein
MVLGVVKRRPVPGIFQGIGRGSHPLTLCGRKSVCLRPISWIIRDASASAHDEKH